MKKNFSILRFLPLHYLQKIIGTPKRNFNIIPAIGLIEKLKNKKQKDSSW
jgi:hypothetical protein